MERRVVQRFASEWRGVLDGCGFNCEGCGVVRANRLMVGYSVEIEYACGLVPYDCPEFHLVDAVYVSLFGTVHRLPRP